MQSRAEMILKKFLGSASEPALDVPAAIVDPVREAVKTKVGAGTFQRLQQYAFEQLDVEFESEAWRNSAEFKEFADENLGLEVPPMNEDVMALVESGSIDKVTEALKQQRIAAAEAEASESGSGSGGGGGDETIVPGAARPGALSTALTAALDGDVEAAKTAGKAAELTSP